MNASETIADIQKEYATLLDSHFGTLGREFDDAAGVGDTSLMGDAHKLHTFVKDYLVRHAQPPEPSQLILPPRLRPSARPVFLRQIDELLQAVNSFWASHYEVLKAAIRESGRLYTLIGDLNGVSTYYPECAVRLGLYFDGVCVVDPLSVVAQRIASGDMGLDEFLSSPGILFAVVKNYLHMRHLTPLLTSATDVPIGIVVPSNRIRWKGDDFLSLRNLAEATTCAIFSELLQRDVGSHQELLAAAGTISADELSHTAERHSVVVEFLKAHSVSSIRELQTTQSRSSPEFEKAIRNAPDSVRTLFPLFGLLQGNFLALDGAELLARDYGISFAQPRHHWTANKFRVKTQATFAGINVPEFVVKQAALLSENTEFLLAASMHDLIKWRHDGILEGVRELYRVRALSLQRSSLDDLERLTAEVVVDMHERIAAEVARVKRTQLSESANARASNRNLFFNGAFGIASNVLPQPAGWLVALAGGLVPTDTIPQFLRQRSSSKEATEEARKSPALHMHDLMTRACMEQAIEGHIEVKIS